MTRYYPIFLNMRGRRCVVVGGGRVAERKVLSLLRAGASVRVISPTVTARLAGLAARKEIQLARRRFRADDSKGRANSKGRSGARPMLVFAATDDAAVQQAVRKSAKAVSVLVNTADSATESDFIVPASFAQGDLLVAISTSGASPALARRVRRLLQVTLGREYRDYLKFLLEARKCVMATVSDEGQRTKVLRRLAGAELVERFWNGELPTRTIELKKWLQKTRKSEQQG